MRKLVGIYKQYGLGFIPRILKSVIRRFGVLRETLLYFEKDLNSEDIEKRLSKYNYSDVKVLSFSEFDNCDYLDENKKALYKKRLESGDYTVFGVFKDQQLVYYSWISFKHLGLPFGFNTDVSLSKDEALLEDSFCHPNYRGNGYHAKVNVLRLKTILQNGKKKVIAIVLNGNTPAIKVQQKSGFKLKKKLILTKIGSKTNIKTVSVND